MYDDSQQFKELITSFRQAEERVNDVLINTNARTVQKLKIKMEDAIIGTRIQLTEKIKSWINIDLQASYSKGLELADNKIGEKLGNQNINRTEPINAYIQLTSNVTAASNNAINIINNSIRDVEQSGRIATVSNVKDEIQRVLLDENDNALNVTYSNGNKVPIKHYSEMLARTSRIMAANSGIIDRTKQLGRDLVICTKVIDSCPICKKFEGKVYSISGNSLEFPSLYEGANAPFKNGYNIIHPNCRHEFLPWIEELYSNLEIYELKKESNEFINYTGKEVIFKQYQAQQSKLRQMNAELIEYREWKQQLGKDMPYKTLGGFRRAKRSNSNEYKLNIRKYLDILPYIPRADTLTKNDIDSIKIYTSGSGYHARLNSYLYNIKSNSPLLSDDLPPDIKRYIVKLDTALSKIDNYKGEVYRRINLTAKQLLEYRTGQEIIFYGYTSTSKANDIYSAGDRNTYMIIKTKTGKYIERYSHDEREEEVLIARNTKMLITSFKTYVEEGGSIINYIELEEI